MATWTRRNGFVNIHYMEHLKTVHLVHVHGMFYSKWSHYRIQSSTTVGSLLHFHSFSSKQCVSRNAMKRFESSTLIYQRIHVLVFTKERTNYQGILRWFTHVLEVIYSVRRLIPLMVQKSGKHQLRLIAYPIIYHGFYTSQVVIAGFLEHQCFSTWLMSCASPRLPGGDFKYTCLMFIPKIGEDKPILTMTFSADCFPCFQLHMFYTDSSTSVWPINHGCFPKGLGLQRVWVDSVALDALKSSYGSSRQLGGLVMLNYVQLQ